jgi:hypothetical protein
MGVSPDAFSARGMIEAAAEAARMEDQATTFECGICEYSIGSLTSPVPQSARRENNKTRETL